MSINVHHKGELVRISASFTDIDGSAVDPTTVSLSVMDPSGNIDAYTYAASEITNSGVGSYYKDVDADESGDWHYWWESTGTGQGAEPGQFVVAPTHF